MQVFIFSLLFGYLSGIIFNVIRLLQKLLKNNLIFTIISDIIASLSSGFLLLVCIFIYNNGIIRLYILLAFLLGITIEFLTLNKLVDFLIHYIYNIIIKTKKSLKQKTKRKEENPWNNHS